MSKFTYLLLSRQIPHNGVETRGARADLLFNGWKWLGRLQWVLDNVVVPKAHLFLAGTVRPRRHRRWPSGWNLRLFPLHWIWRFHRVLFIQLMWLGNTPEDRYSVVRTHAKVLKNPKLLDLIATTVYKNYTPEIFLEALNILAASGSWWWKLSSLTFLQRAWRKIFVQKVW